jgi:acyl carrier protein
VFYVALFINGESGDEEVSDVSGGKTLEIVRSIGDACFGAVLTTELTLLDQLHEIGCQQKLAAALHAELSVEVTAEEIESVGSWDNLSKLVKARLARDPTGRSLVDVYADVERFVREELSHDVNYHWHATWWGDLLNDTASLEDVELVIRMEEAFGFSIPDREAQQLHTVAQTVRYLWRRMCEQNFTLRQRPNDVCDKAFIFHELRRLLVIRGGISRTAVRLDSRLGDLMPSWSFQFWKQISNVFAVNLPYGNLLTRSLGFEKRTTIRELCKYLSAGRNMI